MKNPQSRYTKEFRKEAARVVIKDGHRHHKTGEKPFRRLQNTLSFSTTV